LLGALTFALSIVPVGPPLIWGGASIWLFEQAQTGWSLFMLVYGVAGISSIDNVLKPILISRSSRLPFAATLIGVIGGVIAFGVPGVFLGPILLALAIECFSHRLQSVGEPGRSATAS
jgi:predicted PurR-regulated permease PerM